MAEPSDRPKSPFLDIVSFPAEEVDAARADEAATPWYEIASPFQSVYQLADQETTVDPAADEFAEFLAELYDQEFNSSMLELANEASALYEAHLEHESSRFQARDMEATRMLEAHFAPLAREANLLLDKMAQGVDGHDLRAMTEGEIETLLDQFEPVQPQIAPSFENFLKKLWKKAKKTVKKVASVAKKVGTAVVTGGLSLLWPKLKKLIAPLLQKVLQMAIGKLPAYLRPVAQNLAKRFLGKHLKEVEDEALFQECEDATMDVAEMQQEYDLQVAQLVFAGNEMDQDTMLAELMVASEQPVADPLKQLDDARAGFIREIMQLEEGKEPTAQLENFLPALLPVLKLGFKLAGRDRIIKFLARQLSKLVRRFVGVRYAAPLSRAVVDLGLKYFGLEVSQDDAQHVAGEAVAYTVEETMRHVAALPDYVLNDEQLLESEVVKAFEAAAAAYLPPVLSESVYYERPELQEATSVKGFWVGLPLRGRTRYRKFSAKLPGLKIRPHTLRRIKTWRGRPLAAYLRNRRGVRVGRVLEAQIHLYEAMPGTSLADISRMEKTVQGLGSAQEAAWSQLHPLTPEAAGMLMGEAGLGEEVPPQHLDDPTRPPAVGQRFYFLEIREEQPQMVILPGGRTRARQLGETNIVLNFARDWIQIFIFLSEMEAQELAARVRQGGSVGVIVTSLKSAYEPSVRDALTGGLYRRVKIVHNAIAPQQSDGQALNWLPQTVREKLAEKLLEWLGRCLSEHFRQYAQDFVTAAASEADGVTLLVTLSNPPGLPKISRVLGGEPVVLRSRWFSDEMPNAKVHIAPGYQRD